MKEGLDRVVEAADALLPQHLRGTSLLDEHGNFPEYLYHFSEMINEFALLQPHMPSLEYTAGRVNQKYNPRWFNSRQKPSLFRKLYRATGAELGPDVISSETFRKFTYDKRVYRVGGDPWLGAYFEAHWYEGALNINGQDFVFDSSMKLITASLGSLDLTGGIGNIRAKMSLIPSLGRLDFVYPPTNLYEGQEPLVYIDPTLSDIDNSMTILSLIQGQ